MAGAEGQMANAARTGRRGLFQRLGRIGGVTLWSLPRKNPAAWEATETLNAIRYRSICTGAGKKLGAR
jgi:hypothetical protein